MMIATRAVWKLTPTPGTDRDALIAHCDAVMGALIDIEEQDGRVHSAALSLDARRLAVLIDLAVDTEDHAVADLLAAETLERAVIAAGGHFDPSAKLIRRRSELIPA